MTTFENCKADIYNKRNRTLTLDKHMKLSFVPQSSPTYVLIYYLEKMLTTYPEHYKYSRREIGTFFLGHQIKRP